MHRALPLLAIAWSLACGDSTAPPPFPAVAGTWNLELTFDGLSPSVAFGSGTITIVQVSRDESGLTGSASVTATAGTSSVTLTDFHSASITEAGVIRFRLNPPGSVAVWGFDGQVSGNRITGTHSLISSSGTSTGPWTATRR